MDNLLGTGGATASRLTLPQKIIATGMSVILAFGLSPIGQAPAYAKEKAKAEKTEQVEKAAAADKSVEPQAEENALETQAIVESWQVDEVDQSSEEYIGKDVTYKFKAHGLATAGGQSADVVLEYGKDYTVSVQKQAYAWLSYTDFDYYNWNDAAAITDLVEGTDFTVKAGASGVTELTLAGGHAGLYRLTLNGINNYAGITIGYSVSDEGTTDGLLTGVAPLELNGSGFEPSAPSAKYIYTGEPQTAVLGDLVLSQYGEDPITVPASAYVADAKTSAVKDPGKYTITVNYAKDGDICETADADGNPTSYAGTVDVEVGRGIFGNAVIKTKNLTTEDTSTGAAVPVTAVMYGEDDISKVEPEQYKLTYMDADGNDLGDTPPTAAGSYKVKATLNSTLNVEQTKFDLSGGAAGNEGLYTVADYKITKGKTLTDLSQIKAVKAIASSYVPRNSGIPAELVFTGADGQELSIPDNYTMTVTYYEGGAAINGAPTKVGDYTLQIAIVNNANPSDAWANEGVAYSITQLTPKKGTAAGQFKVTEVTESTFVSTYTGAKVEHPLITKVEYVGVNGAVELVEGEDYVTMYRGDSSNMSKVTKETRKVGFGGPLNAGTYNAYVMFGSVDDEGVFTPDKANYTTTDSGAVVLQIASDTKAYSPANSYTISPYDLSNVKTALVLDSVTYNGLGQKPALTNKAFGGSTAAALQDDVLAQEWNKDAFTFEYASGTDKPVVYDPNDRNKVMNANTYTVTLGAADGSNYKNTGTTDLKGSWSISKLESLEGWTLQIQDPDTDEWLDVKGSPRIGVSEGTDLSDYKFGGQKRLVNAGSDKKGMLEIGTEWDWNDVLVASDTTNKTHKVTGTTKTITDPKAANNIKAGMVIEGGYTVATALSEVVGDVTITGPVDAKYNGENQAPTFTVTRTIDGKQVPVDSAYYDVKYAKYPAETPPDATSDALKEIEPTAVSDTADGFFTNAGVYGVWIIGKGDYAGTIISNAYSIAKFTVTADKITKRNSVDALANSDIEYVQNEMVYTGDPLTFAPQVYFNGKLLKGYDEAEAAAAKAAGRPYTSYDYRLTNNVTKLSGKDLTATIKFNGNFTSENLKIKFDVAGKKFNVTATPESMTLVPGGMQAITPAADLEGVTFTYSFDPTRPAVLMTGVALDAAGNVTVAKDNSLSFGDYVVYVIGHKNGYDDAIAHVEVKVRDEQTITATGVEMTMGETGKFITATAKGNAKISFVPDNSGVVSVNETTGEITALKPGTAKVTVKAAETAVYAPAETTVDVVVAPVDLSKATVELDATSLVYNGKDQAPTVKSVKVGDFVVEPSAYTVSGTGKDAGKYELTIQALLGSQVATGSVKAPFEITKAKNTKFKVTAKTDTLKGKPAHKKVYKKKALYNIKGAQGKVTFKKANKAGGNKIVVKKKGGIVIKKGLKVDTYKLKVNATDAGNNNYKKATSNGIAFKIVIAKKQK